MKSAERADGRRSAISSAVETYVSKSLNAARRMAQTQSDNQKERKAYSATLVQESKDLGKYIVGKRISPYKKG